MGDDQEGKGPRGFFEADNEFDRITAIKMMDDATLLNCYRALSDPRVVQASHHLDLVEHEVRARGLSTTN